MKQNSKRTLATKHQQSMSRYYKNSQYFIKKRVSDVNKIE
jgi:hypothetical protein